MRSNKLGFKKLRELWKKIAFVESDKFICIVDDNQLKVIKLSNQYHLDECLPISGNSYIESCYLDSTYSSHAYIIACYTTLIAPWKYGIHAIEPLSRCNWKV